MIDEEEDEDERQCAGCGLPESQWSNQYVAKSGDLYCCEDCAKGRLCSCESRERSPHVKEAA